MSLEFAWVLELEPKPLSCASEIVARELILMIFGEAIVSETGFRFIFGS